MKAGIFMHILKKLAVTLITVAMLFTMVPGAKSDAVEYKNEGVASFVTRLYSVVLGRTPDEVGMNDWYNKLTSHEQTASEVVRGFFFSQEYLDKEKDNYSYILDLYRCMLNREGDPAGISYWKVRLDAGVPRINVLKGFVDSKEFNELCASYGITKGTVDVETSSESYMKVYDFVVRLYEKALGRSPDYADLVDWQHKLITHEYTGTDVAYGFIFSPENLANTEGDNSKFVTVLYRAIMGREPDDAGLADWVGQLDNGADKEDIFAGFVNSSEFAALCEEYGIVKGDYRLGRTIDPNKPMIALTFDDGPAVGTTRILDALEANGQAATFFVVGSNARIYQETIARADELGCEIGNHTYNHPNLTRCTVSEIQSEINSTNDYIRSATGHNATVMRPPYGANNETVRQTVGLPLILWSIDTRDWETRNTQSTINNVLNNVRDGDIILMHDIHASTVDAAVYLIPELVSRGYQLVTVSELAEYRGGLTAGTNYYSIRP